jgi:DDE_Tnp_1-associated
LGFREEALCFGVECLVFQEREFHMEKEHIDSLKQYLSEVEDPRTNRKKLHLPGDILLLTIMAVVCGCEGWEEIELFGRTRLEFLREHLQLSNGIPSHDTIRRVFMRIRPGSFESVFLRWAGPGYRRSSAWTARPAAGSMTRAGVGIRSMLPVPGRTPAGLSWGR